MLVIFRGLYIFLEAYKVLYIWASINTTLRLFYMILQCTALRLLYIQRLILLKQNDDRLQYLPLVMFLV